MSSRPRRLLSLLLPLAVVAAGCEERAAAPSVAPDAAAPAVAAAPRVAPVPQAPAQRPISNRETMGPGAQLKLTPELRETGRALYASRCAICHGATGAGDGPGAKTLEPKPRDLRDAAWQRQVTDAELDRVIAGGGIQVGKSPLMPPSVDLRGRPELVALRAHVRALTSVRGARAPVRPPPTTR